MAAVQADERAKLMSDPMYHLENSVGDVERANQKKPDLMRLQKLNERMSHDYDLNSALRKSFRYVPMRVVLRVCVFHFIALFYFSQDGEENHQEAGGCRQGAA